MQTVANEELDEGDQRGPLSAADKQVGPCCLPMGPLQNNSFIPKAFVTAASWDIPTATQILCRASHLALTSASSAVLSPSPQPLRARAASSAGLYHKCTGGSGEMQSVSEDTARHSIPMLSLWGTSVAQIHLTDARKQR